MFHCTLLSDFHLRVTVIKVIIVTVIKVIRDYAIIYVTRLENTEFSLKDKINFSFIDIIDDIIGNLFILYYIE